METAISLSRKAQNIYVSSRVYIDLIQWNARKSDDVEKLILVAIDYGYHLGLKDAAEIAGKVKEGEQ